MRRKWRREKEKQEEMKYQKGEGKEYGARSVHSSGAGSIDAGILHILWMQVDYSYALRCQPCRTPFSLSLSSLIYVYISLLMRSLMWPNQLFAKS